jgi:hypothetical protein
MLAPSYFRMFMNPRFFLVAALAVGAIARAETPPPELDTLKLYAGKWDVAVTDNASVKGEASGQWVLEGRFLQQSWSLDPGAPDAPKISGTTMMTYDSVKRVYRAWHYFSSGSFAEADGTWDEPSRTFTWTGRDATKGTSVVTKASFDGDIEKWSIVTTKSSGEQVSSFGGTNTRRKQ